MFPFEIGTTDQLRMNSNTLPIVPGILFGIMTIRITRSRVKAVCPAVIDSNDLISPGIN